MKQLLLPFVASILLGFQSAHAAALYGTVMIGNAPAAGYTLHLECPGNGTTTAATDGRGSFTMLARASGGCHMWVQHGGVVGSKFVIIVSDNPMRFDFTVDNSLNKR